MGPWLGVTIDTALKFTLQYNLRFEIVYNGSLNCKFGPQFGRNHTVRICQILLLKFDYWQVRYSIFSYSFQGNYSFLNLEIVSNSNSCRNISSFCCGKTIQWWKLFKGGNYMRKYGRLKLQKNRKRMEGGKNCSLC